MLRPLAGPGARHVVVVEDDPRLRKMIVTYLNRAGYEVQEAEDGAQGLAAMQTAIPDAVLLDLQMPRMNGVEFLAACRSDPRLATVPVVVYSGAPSDEVTAEQLGARAYLMKPVDLDVLRAVMDRVTTT
ncbi:MAG TPA: response regulator [Chloroflexota bacterium]|jgi:DNA-binding response OmpR family regulator|nr:response regulator [Chloroflexota bacterium]